MSATWDAFQREALAALGHVVYRQAGAVVSSQETSQQPAGTATRARLLDAIARAAGVSAEQMDGLPPLEQLRGAAAKRALWPRLRAMRAAARP